MNLPGRSYQTEGFNSLSTSVRSSSNCWDLIRLSFSHHLETNGGCKHMNGVLVQYFHCQPSDWLKPAKETPGTSFYQEHTLLKIPYEYKNRKANSNACKQHWTNFPLVPPLSISLANQYTCFIWEQSFRLGLSQPMTLDVGFVSGFKSAHLHSFGLPNTSLCILMPSFSPPPAAVWLRAGVLWWANHDIQKD